MITSEDITVYLIEKIIAYTYSIVSGNDDLVIIELFKESNRLSATSLVYDPIHHTLHSWLYLPFWGRPLSATSTLASVLDDTCQLVSRTNNVSLISPLCRANATFTFCALCDLKLVCKLSSRPNNNAHIGAFRTAIGIICEFYMYSTRRLTVIWNGST